MFDVKKVREDFPFINNHQNEVYFDNAATSLKPKSVIDRINHYNSYESCNNHSTDYKLVYDVNIEIENIRQLCADFIGAKRKEEIVFTSGATYSSNLLALSYGLNNLKEGDVILTSYVEHASNILPWFNVSNKTHANIKYIEFDKGGIFNLNKFKDCFKNNKNIKVVVLAFTSNVLSYTLPIKEISKIVHDNNAILICDAAQAIQHTNINVNDLDVDFLYFSGHKLFGPTGVGVLYGKYDLLKNLDPLFYGGGSNARFDKELNITLKDCPYKFESGTSNISSIFGLGKAIEYINCIGLENINQYENELNKYLFKRMNELDNIIIYNQDTKNSLISFNVKNIFAQDTASYLGTKGIYVRSGNHCAKLLHNLIGTDDTVRASLSFYNTKDEIDKLIDALKDIDVSKVLGTII